MKTSETQYTDVIFTEFGDVDIEIKGRYDSVEGYTKIDDLIAEIKGVFRKFATTYPVVEKEEN